MSHEILFWIVQRKYWLKDIGDKKASSSSPKQAEWTRDRNRTERLDFLRKKADVIIDTSHLLIRELKAQIDTIYVDEENFKNFMVMLLFFRIQIWYPCGLWI